MPTHTYMIDQMQSHEIWFIYSFLTKVLKNNSGMSKKDMDVNERERLSNITLTHCKGTSLLLLLFTGEEEPGLWSLSM
jgi:hypothetical protein